MRPEDLTFGNRIGLGQVLSDTKLSDLERFKGVMAELDAQWSMPRTGRGVRADLARYFEAVEWVKMWDERERKYLRREPSALQKKAGFSQHFAKFGQFPTVLAIATRFSRDPDEVFLWPYAKVFNILHEDLEHSECQAKLQELQAKQARKDAKNKSAHRGRV